jgi:hypothetical protein
VPKSVQFPHLARSSSLALFGCQSHSIARWEALPGSDYMSRRRTHNMERIGDQLVYGAQGGNDATSTRIPIPSRRSRRNIASGMLDRCRVPPCLRELIPLFKTISFFYRVLVWLSGVPQDRCERERGTVPRAMVRILVAGGFSLQCEPRCAKNAAETSTG